MSTDVFDLLREAREQRIPVALVIVTGTKGSAPREIGAKMLVYGSGRIAGTVGGGQFESLVVADAVDAIRDGKARTRTFPLHEMSEHSFGAICGGEMTVFIEPQGAPERLIILGAGHCGQALARQADLLGYEVTVVDPRATLAGPAYFSAAVRRVVTPSPAAFFASFAWEPGDAVVLVGQNHDADAEVLEAVTGKPVAYIGMIGSAKKVREVRARLAARGKSIDELSRVHAPMGLDIGSDSPAEIALAVMAEITRVKRGGTGASLRLGD